jgi:predicted transposase YbfD/YdcC
MAKVPIASIESHFSELTDPRRNDSRTRHKLMDMLVIAICAIICGADNWVAVESFGHAKYNWLSRFLQLPHGIPSHDTFSRVFGLIDSTQFEHCFINWIGNVIEVTEGQVVAVDGKQVRGSYDTASAQTAIHIVSAWASTQQVALGQLKVADHSNEIPFIPQLLEMLSISGCIVTTDAMGCQTQIAQQIVDCDADYVLALKANQGQLHEDVKLLFDGIADGRLPDVETDTAQTVDGDHGRIETRTAIGISDPGLIAPLRGSENFVNLNSVVKVIAEREHNTHTTIKSRYYIASVSANASQLLEAIRTHWSIENACHWVLDVGFDEDACRIRKQNGSENFAILRRIALNLLKGEKSTKLGVANKRLKAAWDNDYLITLLSTLF